MSKTSGSSDKKTYFAVGKVGRSADGFREVTIPGGASVKIMSDGLHRKAASAGGKTLREAMASNRAKAGVG